MALFGLKDHRGKTVYIRPVHVESISERDEKHVIIQFVSGETEVVEGQIDQVATAINNELAREGVRGG